MSTNFNNYKTSYSQKNKYNFDLSHKNIFELYCGDIVPFLCLDVIPGDEINAKAYQFAKSAPLIAPQLSSLKMNTRYFFVPYRILWKGFSDFYMDNITEADYMPRCRITSTAEFLEFMQHFQPLYRHFGLPELRPDITEQEIMQYPASISLLPIRAYNFIYFHYYLNQSLFTEDDLKIIKNYMCRDVAQLQGISTTKGNEGKFLTTAKTGFNGYMQTFRESTYYSQVKPSEDIPLIGQGNTIKDLKIAQKLQRFYENVLNAKNQFINYSQKLFGISPDLEYDRPIYLGGDIQSVMVGDIEANTGGEGQPLGSYAGKSSVFSQNGANLYAKEFGLLIGLIDICPEVQPLNYLHRRITQENPLDFFRPELQNTYTDQIKIKDCHLDYEDGTLTMEDTYGYALPYNELRYERGYTVGDMARNLSYWNIQEQINKNIYQGNMNDVIYLEIEGGQTPTNYWKECSDVIFAVNTEPHYYLQSYNNIQARRVLLPNYDSIENQ